MIKYECDMCGAQSESQKKFSYIRFQEGKKTFLVCKRCENDVVRFVESHKESPSGGMA